MTNQKYVVQGSDGQLYGPADVATLNQWALEGRVLAATVLIEQGTNRQVVARDLPGLKHHFHMAPIPQPPPHAQGQQPGSPTIHQPYQPGTAQQPTPIQQQAKGPYSSPPDPIGNLFGSGSKSKIAAAILAFLVGQFGIHRFYLGYNKLGFIMLGATIIGHFLFFSFFWAVVWIWAVIDGVMILTDKLKAADGSSLT